MLRLAVEKHAPDASAFLKTLLVAVANAAAAYFIRRCC
jgi:hypothetical protein